MCTNRVIFLLVLGEFDFPAFWIHMFVSKNIDYAIYPCVHLRFTFDKRVFCAILSEEDKLRVLGTSIGA